MNRKGRKRGKDISKEEYEKHFKNALSNFGMICAFRVEDFKDIEGGHPCWECKNYIGFVEEPDESYDKCKAFPRGIPGEIVTGLFQHNKRHPDQNNDLVFCPKKGSKLI